MQTTSTPLFRTAGAFTATALAMASAPLSAADNADAFPTFDSYIKVTGQQATITGNEAAFQSRTRQPSDYGVGIEDLHYSKDLNKDTVVTVDGRALAGTEDYLLKLNFTKSETGSIEAGYKRFRTFYDGVGGFFPINKAWFPLPDQSLHTDRGEFWAEAKLALKDRPEFTIRYTNETRAGKKDSTIWGDTDFTGLPNNNPPISQVRKIIPSWLTLDERHQELEGSMKYTVGNTTMDLTLFGDWVKNLDTRYVTRFPGEVRPWPTPSAKNFATNTYAPGVLNNQVILNQTDGIDVKTTGVRATTLTVLNPKISIRTGFSFEDVKNSFSGDRPLWTKTPTATGVALVATNNNQGLAGTVKEKVYVGTVSVDIKPTNNVLVNVGIRGEKLNTDSAGSLTSVAATGTPATTVTKTNQVNYSKVSEHSYTPDLGIRYTGIPNVALYANASQRITDGDESYATPYNPITYPVTPPNSNLAFSKPSEDHGDYKLGANWRQSAMLTVRGEVFYKDHSNKYEGYASNLGDYYLVGSKFTGVKLTGVLKPAETITFTSRYIYQVGKMQVTGFLPTYPAYDSMDAKNHTLSETIDWNPTPQFYAQASGNIVYGYISTIYPRAGVTPGTNATSTAAANRSFDTNNVLHNSDNNYITGSVVTGWALSKDDDLQVRGAYYRAFDGNAALAGYTLPYGVEAHEYSATVALTHKLTDKLVVEAKAGYFEGKNDTTGGNTNYHGPLFYISATYGL